LQRVTETVRENVYIIKMRRQDQEEQSNERHKQKKDPGDKTNFRERTSRCLKQQ
jgi:hypothetical protein